jgi:peroxiredoxin
VPVDDGSASAVQVQPLSIGSVAPDFVLPDGDRNEVRLSQVADGRAAVVVFFPWAFTSVCVSELCSIRDRLPELSNEHAVTLAISCDATATLRELTRQQGYAFPLLSDHWPHGEVASSYGVFDPTIGASLRGTFVLDRDRVVRWSVVNAVPDPRDVDDYVRVLAEL